MRLKNTDPRSKTIYISHQLINSKCRNTIHYARKTSPSLSREVHIIHSRFIFRAVTLSKLISSSSANGKSGNGVGSTFLAPRRIIHADDGRMDKAECNVAASNASLERDDILVRNTLDRRKSVENVSENCILTQPP